MSNYDYFANLHKKTKLRQSQQLNKNKEQQHQYQKQYPQIVYSQHNLPLNDFINDKYSKTPKNSKNNGNTNLKTNQQKFSFSMLEEVISQKVDSKVFQQKQQQRQKQRNQYKQKLSPFTYFNNNNNKTQKQNHRYNNANKITSCLKIKHWINQYLQSKATNQDLLNYSKNMNINQINGSPSRLNQSIQYYNKKNRALTREDLLLIYAYDKICQFSLKRFQKYGQRQIQKQKQIQSQNLICTPFNNFQQDDKMKQYASFRRQQILDDFIQSRSNVIQQQMTKSQNIHQGLHKFKGQIQFLLRMKKRQAFLNIKIKADQVSFKGKKVIQIINKINRRYVFRIAFQMFKFQSLSQSNVNFVEQNTIGLFHSGIGSQILSSPLFQSQANGNIYNTGKNFSKGTYFGHNFNHFNQSSDKFAQNEYFFGFGSEKNSPPSVKSVKDSPKEQKHYFLQQKKQQQLKPDLLSKKFSNYEEQLKLSQEKRKLEERDLQIKILEEQYLNLKKNRNKQKDANSSNINLNQDKYERKQMTSKEHSQVNSNTKYKRSNDNNNSNHKESLVNVIHQQKKKITFREKTAQKRNIHSQNRNQTPPKYSTSTYNHIKSYQISLQDQKTLYQHQKQKITPSPKKYSQSNSRKKQNTIKTNLFEYPLENQIDITDKQTNILPYDFNKSISINSRTIQNNNYHFNIHHNNYQKGCALYHLIPDFIRIQQPDKDDDSCYPFKENSIFRNDQHGFFNIPIYNNQYTQGQSRNTSISNRDIKKEERSQSSRNKQNSLVYKYQYENKIIQPQQALNYKLEQRQQQERREIKKTFSEKYITSRPHLYRDYQQRNVPRNSFPFNQHNHYTNTQRSPIYTPKNLTPRSHSPMILPTHLSSREQNYSPMNNRLSQGNYSKIQNPSFQIQQRRSFLPQSKNQYFYQHQFQNKNNLNNNFHQKIDGNNANFIPQGRIRINAQAVQKGLHNQKIQTQRQRQNFKFKTENNISVTQESNFNQDYMIGRHQIQKESLNQKAIQFINFSNTKNIKLNEKKSIYEGRMPNKNPFEQNQASRQSHNSRKGIRSAKRILKDQIQISSSQIQTRLKSSHSTKLLLTLKTNQNLMSNRDISPNRVTRLGKKH